MDYKLFASPETVLRPAPFWSINDEITPEETARQLADMVRVGLSGGFFHSRSGLVTEYLGDRWLECMKAGIEEAKKQGGYFWLYDEDMWPSGNAGGLVTAKNPECRAMYLKAELAPAGQNISDDNESDVLACYVLHDLDGNIISGYEHIDFVSAREKKDSDILVLRTCFRPKNPRWGMEVDANLLHPQTTKEFIEITHELYRKHFGEDFGLPKVVPGIFTDEPHIHIPGNLMAWWPGLPEKYNATTGRDFIADAPCLFFESPGFRYVRWATHRTIHEQFVDVYSRPIYEWCEKYGLEHTGHYLEESNFMHQLWATSGSIMSHYVYQQAPGIDHLGRMAENAMLNCLQIKSAARQLGRTRVLDEIFGVSRHTATFEDFKWIADHDIVLGVNFLCPHLTHYSIRGRRKRDYPPNWNYQQTYWDDLRPLNDYFTRNAYMMTCGKPVPEFAILHPIESAASAHGFPVECQSEKSKSVGEDIDRVQELDAMYKEVLTAALDTGYDFDLADEGYLARIGCVKDGKLSLGEMEYGMLVVPPADTWRENTVKMLEDFVTGGGKLIVISPKAAEVECRPDTKRLKALYKHATVIDKDYDIVRNTLSSGLCSSYRIAVAGDEGAKDLRVQHRKDGDNDIFFIVNTSRTETKQVSLIIKRDEEAPVARWDSASGQRVRIPSAFGSEGVRTEMFFTPADSKIIVCGPESCEKDSAVMAVHCAEHDQSVALDDTWEYTLDEPNVLVLEYISLSLDGGKTFDDPIIEYKVRAKVADHFDTTSALQWQPWVAVKKGIFEGRGGPVILRYSFDCKTVPANASIVIEDIEKGKLVVNGSEVDTSPEGWIWDRSFRPVDISGHLITGTNTVDFHVDYDFQTEVERAYLIGDFGVYLEREDYAVVDRLPDRLTNGSWTDQGLVFYSGRVTYKTETELPEDITNARLVLEKPSGVLYKVRINGKEAPWIMWNPYSVTITDLVKGGTNDIEIEVVPGRQNTLGPLHEEKGSNRVDCAPGHFELDQFYFAPYNIMPYGLLHGAKITCCK